ncbi:Transposase [Psychrobacter sp. LV10R520-6]|nr:Transposase [Psychrobacter sp. LV10R520-6]SNT69077.1 Transposase [Psychrobacter sp. LV10R520-6]SNT69540.1 Transposase [Psychrobacter sp. LV10R520-6]
MPRYSEERKQAILNKLQPPLNLSIAEVSRNEGIGLQTLYNWRNQARQQGQPMPGNKRTPNDWSSATKLATVIETGSLSEAELSEYCRRKGLYSEQIKAWRSDALKGFSSSKQQSLKDKRQQQTDRKHIKQLQRELARKEKALAETAALLVLRKKLDAFWEEHEDD